jgi:hypothetical protein
MTKTKKRALVLTATLVSTGILFLACGGDDVAVNGGGADAGGDSTTGGNDGAAPNDSSTQDSGAQDSGDQTDGDITDGGANFGDGGADDAGDLSDGGSCNALAVGPDLMSDCSALNPLVIGGVIVAGDYTLTKVTDLGTRKFCSGTFAAVSFKGALRIAAGVTSGSDNVDLAINADDTGRRSRTWIVTPAATNKSPMAVDQSCPTTTTTSLPYSSFVSAATGGGAGTQVFEFVDAYGTAGGTALYHFEKN